MESACLFSSTFSSLISLLITIKSPFSFFWPSKVGKMRTNSMFKGFTFVWCVFFMESTMFCFYGFTISFGGFWYSFVHLRMSWHHGFVGKSIILCFHTFSQFKFRYFSMKIKIFNLINLCQHEFCSFMGRFNPQRRLPYENGHNQLLLSMLNYSLIHILTLKHHK